MKDKISIIVPCYNEDEMVELFYKEFFERVSVLPKTDFELVFVDDGSNDETLKVIKQISKNDNRIIYISFSRNFGKEAAMFAGLKAASGDYVGLMDVDLQDPPELLIKMYNKLKANKDLDCVASRRFTRKGEPLVRSFFAKMFYKLINSISETEVVDGARDFRLMKKQMRDEIVKLAEKRRFSKGLFSWVGFQTEWIQYENVERVAGTTKWSFWKLFKYAIEGIVNFSTVPLNLSFVFSGMSFLGALALMIVSIVQKVKTVSLMFGLYALVLFMSGIILSAIGVLGMYSGRSYNEIKNRPVYIIKDSNTEEWEYE